MSQTRDQQRFTISEVAADWHEPMVLQRIMWHPLPALTDNWTHGAASRHTITPISHTRPSPRSRSYYSFPVPLRVGGWVGLSTQQVSNLLYLLPAVDRVWVERAISQLRVRYSTTIPLSMRNHLRTNTQITSQHQMKEAHMSSPRFFSFGLRTSAAVALENPQWVIRRSDGDSASVGVTPGRNWRCLLQLTSQCKLRQTFCWSICLVCSHSRVQTRFTQIPANINHDPALVTWPHNQSNRCQSLNDNKFKSNISVRGVRRSVLTS